MSDIIELGDVLRYRLQKFTKRIVFDVLSQRLDTIYQGEDDGDYYMFIASNGFQVISRSRMDIQTERLWLMGCKTDSHAERSGTMVFATQEMCDKAYPGFHLALQEWALKVQEGGRMTRRSDYSWTSVGKALPEKGRLIVKKWKSGAVWAGIYSGSAKDSAFDFWRYIDV